ncbi:hypothetical protein MNBD_PLANCTO02-1566 [hydrothermal vent metagenome]|uniref:DUF4143 domain-containing protein n=1 Tax=hydrothermal vent metagenome TaxID=652676 RepID=A0A3B1DMD6_9ZZZZ
MYAENLVFNALRKWKGMIQLDYYRENNQEVDFIVQVTPSKYIPIEVKYRNQWSRSDLKGIDYFRSKHKRYMGIVVTKMREDFGVIELKTGSCFRIPLLCFLLLFD